MLVSSILILIIIRIRRAVLGNDGHMTSPVLRGQPDDPLAVEVVAVALRVEGGAHQARGLQYSNFN